VIVVSPVVGTSSKGGETDCRLPKRFPPVCLEGAGCMGAATGDGVIVVPVSDSPVVGTSSKGGNTDCRLAPMCLDGAGCAGTTKCSVLAWRRRGVG
jgi:hypothetical protein